MRYIDINCDIGEGIGNDALIMPYIRSANIACGFHAGDESSMNDTIRLAMKYGVKIGAHVSYLDKSNFGRTEMHLSPVEVYDLVSTQLTLLKNIANKNSAPLVHVKPHGALYNMSARDPQIAKTIANAVKDFEPTLVLFGLSGTHSINEANKTGLKTVKPIINNPRIFVKLSISLPASLYQKIPRAIIQLMMAPVLTSTPVITFTPKPQPAIFPILKTNPPNAINPAKKYPNPGNILFAISCARFSLTVITRQIFSCAPISSRMEIRITNPKLVNNCSVNSEV